MPFSTYVARTPAAFSALLQTAEIGGLGLQPFAPVSVRDEFFDTPTGSLLADGLTLRVREQGGSRTAALRRLRPEAGGDALPDDVRFERGQENRLVPPGPFAEAIRERVGSAPLGRVLSLRQNRTARVGMADGKAVALFSFDVVAYDLASPYVSNEVEVEPLGDATEAHAQRVHDDLVGRGLVPVEMSKFERGLVRVPRSLREAVLLTPAERDALDVAARSGSPLLQRRARVVLLDARGLRPDTIAAQTGLGMARVRYWRLRFREERLGILAEAPDASPRPLPASGPTSASVPSNAPAQTAWDPPETATPMTAAFAPDSEPSPKPDASPLRTTPPEAAHPEAAHPVAEPQRPSGDGATASPGPEADPSDISDLLDLFSPRETGTPLLDADGDGPEAEPQSAPVAVAPRSRTAFPVVLGPVAPSPAQVVREATAERGSPRRPALTGETSLVEAAESTLAYHVAALDAAVDRFASNAGVPEARRLLIAVHRVRLGVETFRRLLPEVATTRLLAALRPLAVDLDLVLDAALATEAVDPGVRQALAARQASAIAAIRARLGGDRHRAWGARARRLLDRLDAQRAGGLLLADDLPPPPDDFVGDVGDVPGPTRLRHIVASLLWSRYEAVRSFEGDLRRADPVSSDVAYHFAIAVSALHFALGLAQASGGPVRDVAKTLEVAEREAVRLRNEQRTAELLAEAAGEERPSASVTPLREIWKPLASPGFRARLAAVSARV